MTSPGFDAIPTETLLALVAPAAFAHANPTEFAHAAAEVVADASASVAMARLLAAMTAGHGKLDAATIAALAAKADANGPFGLEVAELVAIFSDAATFVRVASIVNPGHAAALESAIHHTSRAPRKVGTVRAAPPPAPVRPARPRHHAHARPARRTNGAGAMIGMATAAAMLLALVALWPTKSPHEMPLSSPTAGPTIVPLPANEPANANGPAAVNAPANPSPEPSPSREPDSSVIENETPAPHSSPDSAPDSAVESPQNPAPQTPVNPLPAPHEPESAVENPPSNPPANPDSQPHTPPDSTATPAPETPAELPPALLVAVNVDGRATAADGREWATGMPLRAGDSLELRRGSATLAFVAARHASADADAHSPRMFGRLELHGRGTIRVSALDAASRAPLPSIELVDGEMLLDLAAFPGAGAGDDWRMTVTADATALAISSARDGEDFAAVLSRSRSRLDVAILAGAACASVNGESLAGVVEGSVRLRDGEWKAARHAVDGAARVPAWVRQSDAILMRETFANGAVDGRWQFGEWREMRGTDGVLALVPNDEPGTLAALFRFSAANRADEMLPGIAGLRVRVKLRVQRAVVVTLHVFDPMAGENFSVDVPATAGWNEFEFSLDEFRGRVSGLAPASANRFRNFAVYVPAAVEAADLDHVELIRTFRR